MIIKHQALPHHLSGTNTLSGIYILTSQEHFLLEEATNLIKQAWKKKSKSESTTTTISIQNSSDWDTLSEKANSYSLFTEYFLLDVRYDKKTLDAPGKKFLLNYAKAPNPSCLILIQAPQLALKQLQDIIRAPSIYAVQIYSLNEKAMLDWIKGQLKQKKVAFQDNVPELILKYTEGNMLASAQAIEKISLIADNSSVTIDLVKTQLSNQCHYELFEFSEALLSRNPIEVTQQLRYAYQTKTEPTLILWILAQEIRQLLQLKKLQERRVSFNQACRELNIWPQRAPLYQALSERREEVFLVTLLSACETVEEQIKLRSESQINQILEMLEQIALSLALGKKVGFLV